jgi:hypothetical protein
MNIKGQYPKSIILIVIVLIYLLHLTTLYAQKASAEFISTIIPSNLNTGQQVKDGVQNLTYKDNILYVVNVWAGIQVIDVSNVYKPREIGRYQNEHRAHNLFIDENYGYLSDELEGVSILDLSNPAAISRVGKIATEGNAWWVEANFPYVYIAEEEHGVTVYNITDVTNPVLIGSYDTPGWTWGLNVQGDYVYVADKTGGLLILDFTVKESPVLIGQFKEPKQAKTIQIEDNYLYLTDGPNGLFILDISNPKFPAVVSRVKSDGFIFNVFKSGKYAYLANESLRRLDIVSLTDIKKPVFEASYQADDKIYSVWKKDVYVFVAANSKTLILRHNNPPVLAEIPAQTVDEQQVLTIKPEGYDPDGDPIFYRIKSLPDGARFDSTSGAFSWTPTYEQSGFYKNVTISIIEKTDSKLTTSQSFDITVQHVNRAPALPEVENYTVNENQTLSFEIKEGTDPDKEDKGKLVYTTENLPESAVFDSLKRKFTWTPNYDQSGTYAIDFIVKDPPGATARDASTITVLHVDRKPVIAAIENKIVDENQNLEFTVEGSDPDKEDQHIIAYSARNLPKGAVFTAARQQFTWTPSYDQAGEYKNLLFIITAGKQSDSTTMNITVNNVSRPPVLESIATKTVDEQKPLSFMVSATDPDAEDQDRLKFTAQNLPAGAKFHADSLRFSWTPSYDQAGSYPDISITVTDPYGLSDSKSFTINVNNINRPPVLADIPAQTVDEDKPLNFTVTGSDPDKEDQDKLKYSAKQLPAGATLVENVFNWTPGYDQSGDYTPQISIADGILADTKTAQITVKHVNRPPTLEPVIAKTVDENKHLEFKISAGDPDKEDTGLWKLTVSQLPEGAVFDPATSDFSWTPTFDQSGLYALKFTNTDPAGLTATEDVQVTVNHVNRTPVFNVLTAQTLEENTPLSITIPAGEDPDKEDAQKLIYAAENLPPGATFDAVSRTLTWTPSYAQAGQYYLNISCSDGPFTVKQPLNLTVNNVNRPPEIQMIADQTVDENQELSLQVVFSDPDEEDQGKIQLTALNLPAGVEFNEINGELSWKPTFVQAGVYNNIEMTATDPGGLTVKKSFNITVNNVNRPPVIKALVKSTIAENTPFNVTVEATDPDQEDAGKLQFSCNNLPAGATLDVSGGAFSWIPDFTQAGEYTVNLKVTDSGNLSAETALALAVTNVNRKPVIQPVETNDINENETVKISITAADEDKDDRLKFSLEAAPRGAAINESSGELSWTPDYTQAGEYAFKVKVNDGTTDDVAIVTINVNNVNRKPEISGTGPVTATVGETIDLNFKGSDPDNDKLNYQAAGLPAGANFDVTSGKFSWKPGDDQAGSYKVTVTVSDGTDSAETTTSITVNPPAVPQPEPVPPESAQPEQPSTP